MLTLTGRPAPPSRIHRYRRNRIRNELMPYLRKHFNPRADEALARTAEVLQDEVVLLEEAAGKLLRNCIVGGTAPSSDARDSAEATSRMDSGRVVQRSKPHSIDWLNHDWLTEQSFPESGQTEQHRFDDRLSQGSDDEGTDDHACAPRRNIVVSATRLASAPTALQRRAM